MCCPMQMPTAQGDTWGGGGWGALDEYIIAQRRKVQTWLPGKEKRNEKEFMTWIHICLVYGEQKKQFHTYFRLISQILEFQKNTISQVIK